MCAWHTSGMTQEKKKRQERTILFQEDAAPETSRLDAAMGCQKLANILQTPQFSHGGFSNESFKESVQMCQCGWFTKCPVIVPPGNQIVCCCCFPGWDC